MTRVDTQVVGTFPHTLTDKYAGWFRLATLKSAGTATYTLTAMRRRSSRTTAWNRRPDAR